MKSIFLKIKRTAICFMTFATLTILLSVSYAQDVTEVAKETVKEQKFSTLTLKEIDKNTVGLFERDRPVWNFVYRQIAHPGIDSKDKRAIAGCYFHPLYGLDGEILTINASNWDNHAHHHGVWTSFMTVIRHRPDGSSETYDTWTDDTPLKKDFVDWGEKKILSDGSFRFSVKIGWFINGKEKIMNELTTVTTAPLKSDPKLGVYRVIDFASTYAPVADRITLAADRKYNKSFASLAIRFVQPPKKSLILSENGEVKEDNLELEISWLDYQSIFKEKNKITRTSGVAIFPDPSNPKHKGGWGVRHYGLIATGWPGTSGIDLTPDTPVTLKYHFVIHEKKWTVDELKIIADLVK